MYTIRDYGYGNTGLSAYAADGHEVLGDQNYDFGEGYCTWFVAAAVPNSQNPCERWSNYYGERNACNWWGIAGAKGLPRGSVPQVGAIMCMDGSVGGGAGHVGVILAVDGDTLTVADSNWVSPFHVGIHTQSPANASWAAIQGYIYRGGGGGSDAPNPPSDLSPSGWNEYATGGQINLQWRDNLLKNGQPCDHFEIVVRRWVNGQPGDIVLHVPSWGATPYTWTGYGVGEYVWHVTAYNGSSGWASSADAYFRTSLGPPTDLRPGGGSVCLVPGQIQLQWSYPGPADHFEIVVQRWVGGQIGDTVLHVPSCTDAQYLWTRSASDIGEYVWHVTAYIGASVKTSNLAHFQASLAPPTDLRPGGGSECLVPRQIQLQWSYPGPIDHFEIVVQRWVNGQAGDTVLHVPSCTDTQYLWTRSASDVGEYVWHVTAYSSSSYKNSDVAYFRTSLASPTDLRPGGGSECLVPGQIQLQWSYPGPIDHFEIVVQRWVNGQAGDTVLHVPSCTDTQYLWTRSASEVGEYVWHVTAYSSSSYNNSDVAYFRTSLAPPTDLRPAGGSECPVPGQIQLQWNYSGPIDHFEIVVQRWVDGQAGDTVLHVPSCTDTQYLWTCSASEVGEYVWHVTAYSSSSYRNSDVAHFLTYRDSSLTTMLAGTWLMGLPLVPSDPDAAHVYATTNVTGWQAATQTYHLYAAQTFNAISGYGYWAKYDAPQEVQLAGTPAVGPVNCTVSPGWNLLGNPYQTTMAWSQLNGNGKLQPFAWRQSADGASYELVSDIEGLGAAREIPVWRGFWVWATQGGTVSLNETGPAQTPPSPPVAAWSVRLIAGAGRLTDASNFVGQMKAEAALQAANPPLIAKDYVDLYMLDAQGRRQAVSLAAAGAQTSWDVCVETNLPGAEVTVRFPDLSAVPRNLALTLTDLDAGKTLNMRTSAGYAFTAGQDVTTRHLRLAATPRTGPALTLSGVSVQSMPDSSAVTYCLSAPADVLITVLNIAGRTVANIPVGYQTSGTHTSTWSRRNSTGSKVPAGQYLLRLRCRADDGTEVSQITPAIVR
jgi:surface antigen